MLFSLFVEFTPCCSSQSKVALSFFLIAFPVDAETLCHLHFTDVWISPPCELPLLDFLLLFFFQALADKTCRQQCTSLTDRAPCSQQGNPGVHSSHTLLIKSSMEKAVCEPEAEGEKSLRVLRGPNPSPLPIFFFKVGKRA